MKTLIFAYPLDGTKLQVFDQNNHFEQKKREACKTEKTIQTMTYGGGSIILWVCVCEQGGLKI